MATNKKQKMRMQGMKRWQTACAAGGKPGLTMRHKVNVADTSFLQPLNQFG